MPVIPKQNSTDIYSVPLSSELQIGELAINSVSGVLYTKKTSGDIVAIGGTSVAATSGSGSFSEYIAGPSGSYVLVGGEGAYRQEPPGMRRGSLEVYGRSTDELGNPVDATAIVCSTSEEAGCSFRAVAAGGSTLNADIYGRAHAGTTFAGIGDDAAAIWSDASGGLALGIRSGDDDIAAIFIETNSAIGATGAVVTFDSAVVLNQPLQLHMLDDGGAVEGNALVWDGSRWAPGAVGGSGGVTVAGVSSVNGATGAVTLTAADVGAVPDTFTPPTAVSDLDNDLQYITQTQLNSAINGISITKADIGLGNVDNTSDADKPVSSATQTLIDGLDGDIDALVNLVDTKADASHTHEPSHIVGFVDAVQAIEIPKTSLSDLSNYDLDLGSNKVLYSNEYADTLSLPSATGRAGMFLYVTATGDAYYSDGTTWTGLADKDDIPPGVVVSDATDYPTATTVSNIVKMTLSEYLQLSVVDSETVYLLTE